MTCCATCRANCDRLYIVYGRPSVPPERWLRARFLQNVYSICSERLLIEQLDYSRLSRRFVSLEMDEPVWSTTVFTGNRYRLPNQGTAGSCFRCVVERAGDLIFDEHFTVNGTLAKACASQKSCRQKDGGTDGDGRQFRGESQSNETRASTTDPDARLYRRSHRGEAKLS